MSIDERGQPVDSPLTTGRTHQLEGQLICDLSFGTSVPARAKLSAEMIEK